MMKPRKKRVALVGIGYWGPNVASSLEATGRAELAWLCDTSPDNLARAAKSRPDVALTSDFAQVLADPSVDAIAIATPTATHHALARRALEAGKHVLVEKPLTSTSAEAEDLIAVAEARGLTLMVGHVFLYNAGIRALKDLIDSGEIGEIYYLSFERTNLGPVRTDVNALWDLASHDISILCDLFGALPDTVSAVGQAFLNPSIEDVVFAVFTYADGRRAHVHASWLNPRKVRHLTVVGSQKMVIWNDLDPRAPLQIVDKRVEYPAPGTFYEFKTVCVDGGAIIPQVHVPPPLAEECAHFLDCIDSGARPRSDGRNGRDVVRILEAASESLRRGGATIACSARADGKPRRAAAVAALPA